MPRLFASILLVASVLHSSSSTEEATCVTPRNIIKDGAEVGLSKWPSSIEHGFNVTTIDSSKQIFYVQSFMSPDEAKIFGALCEAEGNEGRFVRSPQRKRDEAGQQTILGVEEQGARTSASCPLLFSLFYLPLKEKIATSSPHLLRELEMTWDVTERAAKLLDVLPSQVEPIQLIRYEPGQFYKVHHDHSGYYEGNNQTGPKGEDRPITMLLFLSEVESGGNLRFPKLGLEFIPRIGDAVAWSNVDAENLADPDMVHEGMPPKSGSKLAANIWVRTEPFDSPKLGANVFKTK
mmetsp:Transcript_24376/g.54970  ORF Transcript_24376/g.54970 Transcript_24376/m.54970 type:complete len:292 (+) Transcript_24376:154-1029(+)|eukprot:CAMPEP_0172628728 /NCGR_PEP_ID=MMETSP1068-20121228/163499_1 /TAXON_ID=35684 /ORGANISM="Pseudopedinella elastica, Strain CCMP716" /LENGTH=291 /DNA_ID=CAMNT_0013439037 /DNA_START=72 /DNA_END=947 /DNA_ORIENTATION=+